MSKIIKVSNLSKSYTISHEGRQRYTALRDVMAQKAKKIFSFPGWKSRTIVTKEEFWALKDVCFEIEKGDRVGIIGRNGAGKSTLLKILSRITEPTTGSIKIKGRVASLLEVGTGFHPELTGRENIFLNGAILGMSRAEIKKHFDAIVDFAEVEKFLDTPVKRYSSGMYVRLAFAVAAHLEPEILVVDEVLAVGDAEFQKKCLGKMEDVSKNKGRTVLFVSHQLDAIEQLTNKTIYLADGKIVKYTDTIESINLYLRSREYDTSVSDYKQRHGNRKARITKLEVLKDGHIQNSIRQGEGFHLKIGIVAYEQLHVDISFVLENFRQQPLFCSHYSDKKEYLAFNGYKEFELFVEVPNLRRGDFLCSMGVFSPDKREYYDVVLHFPLIAVEGAKEGLVFPTDDRWGDLYFDLSWQ